LGLLNADRGKVRRVVGEVDAVVVSEEELLEVLGELGVDGREGDRGSDRGV